MGCYIIPNISGTGSEGWFDPWSLLNSFKRKAVSLGVEFITGEAVDFDTDQNGQINSIKVWKLYQKNTNVNLQQTVYFIVLFSLFGNG